MTNTTEQTHEQQAFERLLATWLKEQHYITVEASTEEDVDASSDRLCFIEQRMWRTEAPDLRAVLVKFEIANADCDMPPPEATASILADLRRLSGELVSPLFQADVWLSQWEGHGGSYFVRDGEAILCGNPMHPRQRSLTRIMEKANGSDAVKGMIIQCCKGLTEEVAA